MSEDKKYPAYEADLKRWKATHFNMQDCERCGNSGFYKCCASSNNCNLSQCRLMTCKNTKWRIMDAGRKHFNKHVRMVPGNVEEAAYMHAHPCNCDKSGAAIMRQQKLFELHGDLT